MNGRSSFQTRQQMRASLLAKATAATLWPFQHWRSKAQLLRSSGAGDRLPAQRAERAPWTEQHAEVAVAALGDPAESSHRAGRVLARRESEVSSEVAAGAEAVNVADEGNQGRGRQDADAGHGGEVLDGGELTCQITEVLRDALRSSRERVDFLEEIPQHISQ